MKNQKILKIEGVWNAEFAFQTVQELYKAAECLENAVVVDTCYVGGDYADGGTVAVIKKPVRVTIMTLPTCPQEEYNEIMEKKKEDDRLEKERKEAEKAKETQDEA